LLERFHIIFKSFTFCSSLTNKVSYKVFFFWYILPTSGKVSGCYHRSTSSTTFYGWGKVL